MDFGIEPINRSILFQEVNKRITIDRSRFKTNNNGIKIILFCDPCDPLGKGFCIGNGV
ncbi:hypothetical protein Bccel_1374 [Pseudobacteroides cellulosolvens ATCC 35603 = DSM 2933]|uniref:Uncharacterized protein n=1 Tax=Pseudobacteroides cellulosolvens ATCC 35603 = DSM 2933 TaxID=398512 RepID=A0A0L6JL48_9FIRM|nr:hypothetical protein Bccel_1374 [Pseudobacteroides cellulosolvens ATCC 35603 = DSM 2933]